MGKLCSVCPALEVLVLGGNCPGPGPLPAEFCNGLQQSQNLRFLHLGDCGLTAASLGPLCHVLHNGSIKNLERLNLVHNKLGVSSLSQICRALEANATLHTLELSANDLGP